MRYKGRSALSVAGCLAMRLTNFDAGKNLLYVYRDLNKTTAFLYTFGIVSLELKIVSREESPR